MKDENQNKQTLVPRPSSLVPKLKYIVFLLILFAVSAWFVVKFSSFPELESFLNKSYSVVVTDRNGEVLRVFPAEDGVKREWAELEEIPEGAVAVFVRAEDRRFYFHPGVDLIAAAGAAVRNARAGRVVSGASTITMQLARMVRPHGEGMRGKALEALDALRLEAKLSKMEILTLWLNNLPFGSNIEGVAAMTRARFGRPVGALDDARAALLAVIPRRPGLYDPAQNADVSVRAALALSGRCGLGLTEAALVKAAAEAAIETGNDAAAKAPFNAPHYTERVYSKITSSKAQESPIINSPIFSRYSPYLQASSASRPFITTSLDLRLQLFAEAQLRSELALLTDNRVSNGAILALDNATGEVLVYVGSADWFDESSGGKIDGVRSLAQPGSCLKPFLYAMALDAGFTPAAVLPDLPTVFGGREAYVPSNFNMRFNGPVRLRVALASSLNVPAVYMLERLGVGAFEDFLAGLGFESISSTRGSHGTGLALGNAEVSLEELVRAFSAFPRGGLGIMTPYAAWAVCDMLSDRASRFVGFGPAPSLATPFVSMFKTGTANQYQHIWALGATSRFTVGVWMGNFSGATVVGRTGSSIPARIASRVLEALEADAALGRGDPGAKEILPAPPGLDLVPLCALSGLRAGTHCRGVAWERLPRSRVPGVCGWHGAGGVVYPPEYRSWLAEKRRVGNVASGDAVIRMPAPGSVFYLDSSLPADAQGLRLEASGFDDGGALVYLDGELQGALNHAGVYSLPLSRGRHTAMVEAADGAAAATHFEVR